ncbi:hypothetical protein TNCV_4697511 [Trichonephila clavipes]|nr:hypothetical protein TNCV_4697511 [Trichonephila clavipes]
MVAVLKLLIATDPQDFTLSESVKEGNLNLRGPPTKALGNPQDPGTPVPRIAAKVSQQLVSKPEIQSCDFDERCASVWFSFGMESIDDKGEY